MRNKPAVLLLTACLFTGAATAQDQTAASLWQAYKANPDGHSHIPNCSYAGYAAGEAPLPDPVVVANVKVHGAAGNGEQDDTAAFARALQAASEAGGGAVLVPAGTYRLEGMLYLKHDMVVLRGEGAGKTTLDFPNPLSRVIHPLDWEGKSGWSWSGGLVWIGPADTFAAAGELADADRGVGQAAWEYWRPGDSLASVTSSTAAGEATLTVDRPTRLVPGQMVMMTWQNTDDHALLREIAGVAAFDDYHWSRATWITSQHYPRWQWPVRIQSIRGNKVTLSQPLRIDARPSYHVKFHELGPAVRNAGIEHLTIRNHAPRDHRHLTNAGYNAIYINRAYDCFVRGVEVTGAENGIGLAATKHVTVTGIRFTGEQQHHHTLACRVNAHDNLFEDFIVDGPHRVKHGINTEWLSSGNVWRRGKMLKGTFDSHRALSFDSIRTDITLRNDADGAGGGDTAGPFLGKRVVHWNIRITDSPRQGPGEFVNQPGCLPRGALVGIQGAPLVDRPGPGMPSGDLGCIVAEQDVEPQLADLYDAQLRLRLKRQ